MASSYLGQPQAVRGERHNRFVKLSGELCIPVYSFLKIPSVDRYVCVKNILKQAPGNIYAHYVLLTSTCIQMLYFLQMSEMAMRGSNAPYTVVPAVALTKKGTKPCANTNKKNDCP